MTELTTNGWALFTVLFSGMLIITFFMAKQAERFYTKDPVRRKFSIMELEIPASAKELYNLIRGLYALSPVESKKAISALKGQLMLDFVFMPFAYGSIFIICWQVANKMGSKLGQVAFLILAFLQLIPWICDIIENVYLLGKIRPDNKDIATLPKAEQEVVNQKHKRYLWMEAAKWGIALTAAVCAISAVCYFWLSGSYTAPSSLYFFIVLAEIIVFGIISSKMRKV